MNTKGYSIASLVLGIVAVVACWFGIGAFIALACSIVAIVLGAKGRKGTDGKGMATAGLVLGIIAVVLSGIMSICWLCTFACVSAVVDAAAGAGL